MDNACLIIEGAMRLHNYLVDYRSTNNTNNDLSDYHIFNETVIDSASEPLQVGNDTGRTRGRVANSELSSRNCGILLRNQLTNEIALHDDLRRPRRDEWQEDIYTHMRRL